MQHQQYTWEEGPRHGATTERAKSTSTSPPRTASAACSPRAGTRAGKAPGRTRTSPPRPTTSTSQAVVAYGKSKGVEFVAHNETGANIDNYEAQIDEAFALYERLGIHYLKTGYVGQIPGQYTYSQRSVNHFRLVLEKAARHKINVVCHECVHATGEMRTYPNALAREAVRGQEYDAFSAGNTPAHTLTIPFTRMLSGPMDYTPGIMNILWDPQSQGRRVHTTVAKQLSYYLNYFSGVQMAADLPEHYAGAPGLAFIEDVPAEWDESRVLSARVADHLVTARRAGPRVVRRRDDRRARADPAVPAGFLGRGLWVAESYTDAAATDYATEPDPAGDRQVAGDAARHVRRRPGQERRPGGAVPARHGGRPRLAAALRRAAAAGHRARRAGHRRAAATS